MKKIEWFWNMIYYNIYRFDIKMGALFNYVNPLYWFNKIPAIKKYHAKHGVDDVNEFIISMLDNPKSGTTALWAGSIMGILIVLMENGLLIFLGAILEVSFIQYVTKDITHFTIFIVVIMIPTILINTYLLFRKDKYLNYFKKFDLMSKEKKRKYGWITLFVVIFILVFFISSFLVLK